MRCLFLLMAWKNIEETCSAPRPACTAARLRPDLVYVSMCEGVRCVCVRACLCHRSVPSLYCQAPRHVVLSCKHKGTEQHPRLQWDPSEILSLLFFSFPLVLNLSPIYEAFLCGCVTWFKASRERASEGEGCRFVLLGFVSHWALIFLSPLPSCG